MLHSKRNIIEGGGGVVPRLSRQHNHGPRHTSSVQQCNGHLCRQTRSLNTAVVLRTETRA